MSFGDYWENSILDTILASGAWLGLSTADPGDAGATVAEPSGGSYALVEIPAGSWAAASGGSKATDAAVTFATPTGDWGTITHAVLWSNASRTNFLAGTALTTSVEVNAGSVAPEFAAGDIVVSLD